ncbi:MAG: NUDIX domain-containing protein [Proteobacteria bacterium]|nr:NUDIX domain-containing protein [Pseudomonadota bacterium]
MLKSPIYRNSLRYKLAQKILWLLFGVKEMYISPWQHTAVGTGGLLFHNGKLLLGQRAAHTASGGKFGVAGGYVDFEKGESPSEALVREAWEEAGIHLKPFTFDRDSIFHIDQVHDQFLEGEFDKFSRLDITFIRLLDDSEIQGMRDTEEMANWRFYTLPEVEDLHTQNILALDIDVVRAAFAAL